MSNFNLKVRERSSVFFTGVAKFATAIRFLSSSYIPILLINVCFLKDAEKLQNELLIVFFIGTLVGSIYAWLPVETAKDALLYNLYVGFMEWFKYPFGAIACIVKVETSFVPLKDSSKLAEGVKVES